MAEVLVLVDRHADGSVRKNTFEMLTIARSLGDPSAVVLGGGASDIAEPLAEYGAAKIYDVTGDGLAEYHIVPSAEALAQIADTASPAAILIPSNTDGKEIAARLALKIDGGLITDAVAVQSGPVTTQSVFAGAYTVDARVTTGTPIITVKPNSAEPEAVAGAAQLVEVSVTISDVARGARIVESSPRQSSGRPELAEAAIVVSGGRGTGGDFSGVESFADSLGAAVGASRAAVDAGWYPHGNQVGQTGKQVSPQLYVACGISGAIQHRAGMQTSKTIVAVNKDPEAPIFELVDFGVVGDLFQVLPSATDGVKAARG